MKLRRVHSSPVLFWMGVPVSSVFLQQGSLFKVVVVLVFLFFRRWA